MIKKFDIKAIKIGEFEKYSDIFKNMPLFCEPFWLKTVLKADYISFSNKGFYLTASKNGTLLAAIPVCYRKKFGKKFIIMPYLTPYFTLMLNNTGYKKYKYNTLRKAILSEFIDFILNNGFYFAFMSFSPEPTVDFQPAIWKGLSVFPRYTYLHERDEEIQNTLAPDIKNDLRYAEKKGLRIEKSDNIDSFIKIWKYTLKRQDVYSCFPDILSSLFRHFIKEEKMSLFLGVDEDGRIQSGCLVGMDNKKMYYLAGGDIREIRGAGSSGIVRAMKHAKERGLDFDFEGSMIKGIENYFRKFGGNLTPYFNISTLAFQAFLKLRK